MDPHLKNHSSSSLSQHPLISLSTVKGLAMESSNLEVATDFGPFFRVFKDGRVERFLGTHVVPPSLDSATGVHSKDISISPETGVSARLYIPKITDPTQKLPLLVYFHGGGFCVETSSSPTYHNYLNSLVSEANVVAVSVDYGRAPEHRLPISYDDSWTALQWVASHCNGEGTEDWLKGYADFERVFLAGDSAGPNIAHNMAIRAGVEELGFKVLGLVLVHSFVGGKEPIGAEPVDLDSRSKIDGYWRFIFPSNNGLDDPLLNPTTDTRLAGLGCRKVMIWVAEKDRLRDRDWLYYESLKKSGWRGEVEIVEAEGEDHVFHLLNPTCDKAVAMLRKIALFLNQDKTSYE